MSTHKNVSDAPTELMVSDALRGTAKSMRRNRNLQLSAALINVSAVLGIAGNREGIFDVASTADKVTATFMVLNCIGAVALSAMAVSTQRLANRLDDAADYYEAPQDQAGITAAFNLDAVLQDMQTLPLPEADGSLG